MQFLVSASGTGTTASAYAMPGTELGYAATRESAAQGYAGLPYKVRSARINAITPVSRTLCTRNAFDFAGRSSDRGCQSVVSGRWGTE
eukprot:2459136-Rhodomonas_salina.3